MVKAMAARLGGAQSVCASYQAGMVGRESKEVASGARVRVEGGGARRGMAPRVIISARRAFSLM